MDVRMSARKAALVLGSAWILMTVPGCAGFWSQMLYFGQGQMVPAEYDDLSERRVAVVCVSENSSYGTGQVLAREVSGILRRNVEEIDLVRPDQIADWIDREGWDEIDYREIGRGVKAERVIAIDLAGFGLYKGSSMYRGRAHVTVTVYDMTDQGREVFRKTLPEVRFPLTGPYPVGDISEATFRRTFLQVLARNITKYFHEYDLLDDFGADPAFIGT
ncbi:MAG: hypothetical protein CMJ64_05170 [Planctomycetaceae bacterium]|nr:hypothetical protein [Planctomycetaceae bacterium]